MPSLCQVYTLGYINEVGKKKNAQNTTGEGGMGRLGKSVWLAHPSSGPFLKTRWLGKSLFHGSIFLTGERPPPWPPCRTWTFTTFSLCPHPYSFLWNSSPASIFRCSQGSCFWIVMSLEFPAFPTWHCQWPASDVQFQMSETFKKQLRGLAVCWYPGNFFHANWVTTAR